MSSYGRAYYNPRIDVGRHAGYYNGGGSPRFMGSHQIPLPSQDKQSSSNEQINPIVMGLALGLISLAAARAQPKPQMPPSPQLPPPLQPETLFKQRFFESKLAELKLGTQKSDKDTLRRERRRRSLSLAGLDFPEEEMGSVPGPSLIQNVRRF